MAEPPRSSAAEPVGTFRNTLSKPLEADKLGVPPVDFAGPEVTSQAVRTLRSEIDGPAAGATIEPNRSDPGRQRR
jgi:hypothetical protein